MMTAIMRMLKNTHFERLLFKTMIQQLGAKIGIDRRYIPRKNYSSPYHKISIRNVINVDFIDNNEWEEVKVLRNNINHYLKHEFTILGSGWVCVNDINGNIQWGKDVMSGYVYPTDKTSNEILSNIVPEGVDIKYPWELSRMQFLPEMAVGAYIYGDLRKACCEEYEFIVNNFIEQNPIGYGVNWACSMDVGLRITSILLAHDIFSNFHTFNEKFNTRLIIHAVQTAQYIASNLEKNLVEDKSGNHYLSNLLGLLVVGLYIDTPLINKYFHFAVREYLREIPKQYFEDGGIYEYSTAYQRLDSELTSLAIAIMLNRNVSISQTVSTRIQRSLDLLHHTLGRDERILQIGDNDSGRVLKITSDLTSDGNINNLSNRTAQDMLSALFKEYRPLRIEGFIVQQISKSCLPVLLPTVVEPICERLKDIPCDFEMKTTIRIQTGCNIKGYCYPNFGLGVFQSDNFSLYVRIPVRVNKGKLIHIHSDFLHFEMVIDKHRYFADQGSYVYSRDIKKRLLFRSEVSHNVPCHKWNQMEYKGCWGVVCNVYGALSLFKNNRLDMWICYNNIFHFRSIQINTNSLVITDRSNREFDYKPKEFSYRSDGYGCITNNISDTLDIIQKKNF